MSMNPKISHHQLCPIISELCPTLIKLLYTRPQNKYQYSEGLSASEMLVTLWRESCQTELGNNASFTLRTGHVTDVQEALCMMSITTAATHLVTIGCAYILGPLSDSSEPCVDQTSPIQAGELPAYRC